MPSVSPPSSSPPLLLLPHESCGSYRLGMSLNSCLEQLQINALKHCAGNKGTVAIQADQMFPTQSDITLQIPSIGVRLLFDPLSQRLSLIDVYDVAASQFEYMNRFILFDAKNKQNQAALPVVYDIFGPTYGGTIDLSERVYLLRYPGMTLAFNLPSDFNLHTVKQNNQNIDEVLLSLPVHSAPTLSRLFIHCGDNFEHHRESLVSQSVGDPYYEPITVNVGQGLVFHKRNALIGFDSSVQDLLTILGAPQNIYLKQLHRDKMAIHKTSVYHTPLASSSSSPGRYQSLPSSHSAHSLSLLGGVRPVSTDYWFNYTVIGVDILIDGLSHMCKKFVLHTNFIDRPEFGVYNRCNFTITKNPNLPSSSSSPSSLPPAHPPALTSLELPPAVSIPNTAQRDAKISSGGSRGGIHDNLSAPLSSQSGGAVTPSSSSQTSSPALTAIKPSAASSIQAHSNWADILAVMGSDHSRPMLSTKGSGSGGASSVAGAQGGSSANTAVTEANVVGAGGEGAPHPFPSTSFFAYQGVIFEIMKNTHIASVTIFNPAE